MFLTGRKASSSGDRSPYGSFWFEPVGMRSSSGIRVTADAAMRLSAVYSCVRVLAETFAVLPIRLYKRKKDGSRDLVTDHWLYKLLAKRPNDWQTPFEWREMMMGHLALRGNAFNQIVANRQGQITQLIPLHPDRTKIELLGGGGYRYAIAQPDGTTIRLSRGEVWHIRGLSSDGYMGMSPIQVAADVFGAGLAAQQYGANFFANDAKPGGWLEMTGKFADQAARETFKESWKKAQSGANRGSTAVLENGMKYHELSLNNGDAQFIETRKLSRSEIASIFRIPPHLIGDLDRATFSNIEQQSLDFVMHTMTPIAERWESSIDYNLLPEDEGIDIEFDFANLLRGDRAARATYYTSGINAGWMVRNEARISEGLNPLPGLDEPLRPLNMVEESEAPDEQAENDNGADDQVPQQDQKTKPTDARMTALAETAAQRVARKEAVRPVDESHAKYVMQVLSVSAEVAQTYCQQRASMTDAQALEALTSMAIKGTL